MSLTSEDVGRIAHLARLELSAAEQRTLLEQLNGFFAIVERMRAVDTHGIEPLYTPLSAVQAVHLRLRDDAVTEDDRREANQKSAPAVQDGLFLVPKVVE
jgi:aspartyl-tRNA(Asn)/glutamyl-tRNA(Gln) amidotransferase subunit C